MFDYFPIKINFCYVYKFCLFSLFRVETLYMLLNLRYEELIRYFITFRLALFGIKNARVMLFVLRMTYFESNN